MNKADNAYYAIGKRDAHAEVLAFYHKKIRLPILAMNYELMAGERHFSHSWHTGGKDV